MSRDKLDGSGVTSVDNILFFPSWKCHQSDFRPDIGKPGCPATVSTSSMQEIYASISPAQSASGNICVSKLHPSNLIPISTVPYIGHGVWSPAQLLAHSSLKGKDLVQIPCCGANHGPPSSTLGGTRHRGRQEPSPSSEGSRVQTETAASPPMVSTRASTRPIRRSHTALQAVDPKGLCVLRATSVLVVGEWVWALVACHHCILTAGGRSLSKMGAEGKPPCGLAVESRSGCNCRYHARACGPSQKQ